MVKKRGHGGRPFSKNNDERRNSGCSDTSFDGDNRPIIRESREIYEQISTSSYGGNIPAGARLRPLSTPQPRSIPNSDVQNFIIDEAKMLEATNNALKEHHLHAPNHIPLWRKSQMTKVGFGVKMSFQCHFKNCHFESKLYDFYDSTSSGQPTANLQVGVAMSKTDITPKTVELLGTAMNLATPCAKTLHKSYSKALSCTATLAEEAMADNRETVVAALRLKGVHTDGDIPSVDVATDGQYSNRSYHCPTGKSDSVSVPVIEQETGHGLLIQHCNLSHRDGTLDMNTHVNSAETIAAKQNLENTVHASRAPLSFATVTVDGDTGVAKALRESHDHLGLKRPIKRRACYFHGVQATKRKYNREVLLRMTLQQKQSLEEKNRPGPSVPLDDATCMECERKFKNQRGLAIHRKRCNGEKPAELEIKGLEPMFLLWEKSSGKKVERKEKIKWKDGIRVWLLKRMKLELNVGLAALNPSNSNMDDDSEVHESLRKAGDAIIPCLSGDHGSCALDSMGCAGDFAPADYSSLPNQSPLGPIPSQTSAWLKTIVDCILGKKALGSLVVNGKKASTSLVESIHKEIRLPIPKGKIHRKNETNLIKSGCQKNKQINRCLVYSLLLFDSVRSLSFFSQ